jgi:hypothetical protein
MRITGLLGVIASWGTATLAAATVSGLLIWIVGPHAHPVELPMAHDPTRLLNSEGLRLALYLVTPATYGVTSWREGDFAAYEYRKAGGMPVDRYIAERVEFEVLASAASDVESEFPQAHASGEATGDYWLRAKGLRAWRERIGDLYSVASPRDLWFSPRNRSYERKAPYFPLRLEVLEALNRPAVDWVLTGTECINVGDRVLDCVTRRGRCAQMAHEIQLWSHREAGPLGIVRIQVGAESLQLLEWGAGRPPVVDATMSALLTGRVDYAGRCTACHPAGHFQHVHEWLR